MDFNEGLRVQIEDLTAGPVGCGELRDGFGVIWGGFDWNSC